MSTTALVSVGVASRDDQPVKPTPSELDDNGMSLCSGRFNGGGGGVGIGLPCSVGAYFTLISKNFSRNLFSC